MTDVSQSSTPVTDVIKTAETVANVVATVNPNAAAGIQAAEAIADVVAPVADAVVLAAPSIESELLAFFQHLKAFFTGK